jgi:hypothetical protein
MRWRLYIFLESLALVGTAEAVAKVSTGRVLLPLCIGTLLAAPITTCALRTAISHVLATKVSRRLGWRVAKRTMLATKLTYCKTTTSALRSARRHDRKQIEHKWNSGKPTAVLRKESRRSACVSWSRGTRWTERLL